MSTSFELEGFEPISRIGGGGFGDVWLSRQTNVDRQVAIKVGHSAIQDETIRLRFDRECKALGRLSGHPNIVDVYTAGSLNDGRPYLVLEYIDGGTLWQRLKRSPVPEAELRSVGSQMAAALAEAHSSGVLHRDLKPENILIRSSGDAVLGDFGIARLHDGANTTSAAITASVAYAAPEILSGKRANVASDLYGIGICLLAAVFRSVPFVQKTDESIHPIINRVLTDEPPDVKRHGVSNELAAIINSLLSKDPGKRPASATDLIDQFAALPPIVGATPQTSSPSETQIFTEGEGKGATTSAKTPATASAGVGWTKPPPGAPRPGDAAPGLHNPLDAPTGSAGQSLPETAAAQSNSGTPLSESNLRSVPGPFEAPSADNGPFGSHQAAKAPSSNLRTFALAYAATLIVGGIGLFVLFQVLGDDEPDNSDPQQALSNVVINDQASSAPLDADASTAQSLAALPDLNIPLAAADLSFGDSALTSEDSPGPGGATLCDNAPPTTGLTEWKGQVISTETEERVLYQIVSRFGTAEMASDYVDAYAKTNDCESWDILGDGGSGVPVTYAALQTPPPSLGDQSRLFAITGQVDSIDSIHARVLLVQSGTDVLTLTLSGPSSDDVEELELLASVAVERLTENA